MSQNFGNDFSDDESGSESRNGNDFSFQIDESSSSTAGSSLQQPEMNLTEVVDELRAEFFSISAQFACQQRKIKKLTKDEKKREAVNRRQIQKLETELTEVKKKMANQAQVNKTRTHLITQLAREVKSLNEKLAASEKTIKELKGPQPSCSKKIGEKQKRKGDEPAQTSQKPNQQASSSSSLAPPPRKKVAANPQQKKSPSVLDDDDVEIIEQPMNGKSEPLRSNDNSNNGNLPAKNRFSCLERDCERVFDDRIARNIHMNEAHGYTYQREKWICSKSSCRQKFLSREDLIKHKSSYHRQYQ